MRCTCHYRRALYLSLSLASSDARTATRGRRGRQSATRAGDDDDADADADADGEHDAMTTSVTWASAWRRTARRIFDARRGATCPPGHACAWRRRARGAARWPDRPPGG